MFPRILISILIKLNTDTLDCLYKEEEFSTETKISLLIMREPVYCLSYDMNWLRLMFEVTLFSCTYHAGSLGEYGCVNACPFQPHTASGKGWTASKMWSESTNFFPWHQVLKLLCHNHCQCAIKRSINYHRKCAIKRSTNHRQCMINHSSNYLQCVINHSSNHHQCAIKCSMLKRWTKLYLMQL